MDIFNKWKKIEEVQNSNSSLKKEEIMNVIFKDSVGTMEELKKRFQYKINWTIVIGLGVFIFSLFYLHNTGVLIGSAAILCYYVYGYFSLKNFYKKMDSQPQEMSTLEVLKHNYNMITGALKSEESVGRFFFPIVIASAILVSNSMGGKSIAEIIAASENWIIFAVAVIFMVPVIMWGAKKANETAYGEYITDLEDKIQRMEKVN